MDAQEVPGHIRQALGEYMAQTQGGLPDMSYWVGPAARRFHERADELQRQLLRMRERLRSAGQAASSHAKALLEQQVG